MRIGTKFLCSTNYFFSFLTFQVGYPTALDVFIIICFVTVFAALVEFAILNFFDTLVRRIKKKDRERKTILNFIKQLSPQQGLIREKPRRTVSQMSMNDDGLEDENLLSPEDEEPTNEWVTIETMVVDNGVESTKNKRYIQFKKKIISTYLVASFYNKRKLI